MNLQDIKAATAAALGLKRRGSNREIPGAYQPRGLFSEFNRWSLDKALKDGYEINEWVHACVNAYAHHAGMVPWRVSEFTDSEQKALFHHELKGVPASQRNDFFRQSHRKAMRGKWGAEVKSHLTPKPNDPLEQLLEQPNRFTTRQRWIERATQHLFLGGNSVNVLVRGKVLGMPGYKTPFEIWPLFPQAVEVERDGQVPVAYNYAPEGKNINPETEKSYDPADIVHFAFTDPRDPIWGMAPLTAASKAVDTDVQFAKWNYSAAKNRFVPDVVISYREGLDPKAYSEARRRFGENQTTDGPRAPFISGNPVDVHQMSLSPIEMDFIKSRGLNRQSICTIFKIFPPVIAVLEGVQVGNMDTVLRHHWIQAMIPFMDRLMGDINLTLTPEFGDNRLAWYDTNNVEALSENLMERRRVAKIMHTMGIPLTELNRNLDMGLDLADVKLADEPIFGAGVTTATMLENGVAGSGGNPNTAPEGGDPGEPGDGTDPTEPPPEDVVPNDPGDDNPDTLLAVSNGNSDPHKGIKRWTYEEMSAFIDLTYRENAPWYERRSDYFEVHKDEDYFEVLLGKPVPAEFLAAAAREDDVILEEGANDYILWFYHGTRTEERRERLLERARQWGYSV